MDRDVAELARLEEGLWRAEQRFDPQWLEAVLAPDFFEVGRSGRRWDRAAILAMPAAPIDAVLPLPSFAVRWLAPDVALVTYESRLATPAGRVDSLRSSVWSRTPTGWRLRFHQGTPAPDEAVP